MNDGEISYFVWPALSVSKSICARGSVVSNDLFHCPYRDRLLARKLTGHMVEAVRGTVNGACRNVAKSLAVLFAIKSKLRTEDAVPDPGSRAKWIEGSSDFAEPT